jgi:hypothetical protein
VPDDVAVAFPTARPRPLARHALHGGAGCVREAGIAKRRDLTDEVRRLPAFCSAIE